MWAPTFLTQALNDKHEYGEASVSVRIWHIEGTLKVLCHELGHVKYIIPNLEVYIKFYRKQYKTPQAPLFNIGHSPLDKSGEIAWTFERKFRKDYSAFLKNHSGPLATFGHLTQKLRKNDQYLENMQAFL